MSPEWVRHMRDQGRQAGVPFFFKPWGGMRKKEAGRRLDGRTYDESPDYAKPQMPEAGNRALLLEAVAAGVL